MKANTIDVVEVMARAMSMHEHGDEGDHELYSGEAQAALEAIRSAGYVVVPVEPTEAMLYPIAMDSNGTIDMDNARSCYSQILAAAEGGE